MRIGVAVAALALTVSGCRYRPTPVPIVGNPASIRALAGSWDGRYLATQSHRSGSISFTIRVEDDSAFGDVLMEQPPGVVIRPADDPIAHLRHSRGPQLLAIRFVDILGGEVSGALEPYIAPDCDCTVVTSFTGYVRGDTVRGTFATRGHLIETQTGTWVVARRR